MSSWEDAFLAGGGEMGERTRAFGWSSTPIGSPANWPQSLKTAVSICLGSRYPIVVWWGNPAYTMFYNDAYISFLGVTKHPGWLGRSGRECWSEIWPTIGPMLEGVFATGDATWSEDLLLVLHRNLPREEGYFTFSYSPIRDDAGAVGGIFCACYETTGRVIGERRLRTLRDLSRMVAEAKTAESACETAALTLGENSADIPFALIYLLEGDARTARLVATTGLPRGSAAASERIDVQDPVDRPGTWPLRRVFESAAPALVQDLAPTLGPLPGGPWPESPQAALILPIAAPGQTGPTGFLVTGLSPRRILDSDYRSFFDLIAGHVGTAIANARAYEEERRRAEALAELDRAKTAFFSNVSHEFRTPLTLMLGPLEDALAQTNGLPAADRERLEVAHRNSLRLLKLVNTLLDFSRIEAGRLQASYEPTDLPALTAELASVFRSAIERAGMRLIVDCPPLGEPIYVDREMWEKIVLNLLSNAFKFTFEGEIEVSLKPAGDSAELAVRDTGTGIPAEELAQVFERFHRVKDARGRTFEGSGIGLALVQELVRLHGGAVRVASELDRGTVFTVSIPRGSAHLPADRIGAARMLASTGLRGEAYVEEALRWLPDGALESHARFASEGLPSAGQPGASRVLLADDNADMRDYVRRLLSHSGYEVETVADGLSALEAARERAPDLVLADVMMPRLDGFGLLQALRADERLKAVPVVLLSARAGEESRVEGMQAGADDYLVKPFSARELLARAGAHLQAARLRRETSEALRESEQRFRRMADAAPALLWVTEPDGSCTFLSRGWYEYTGLSEDEGLGFGWLNAVHPDDREAAGRTFREGGKEREAFWIDYRLRRADGEYRWCIDAGRPRYGETGEFLGYVGSVIDVHERKQTEQALRDSEARFRILADNMAQLAWTCDRLGNVTWYNQRWLDYTGLTFEEMKGWGWSKVQHPDHLERVVARIKHSAETGEPWEDTFPLRGKDGNYRWFLSRAVPIRDEQGNLVRWFGTNTDVTEQRLTEERLRDMERLESVGRLAGGVAHEVNNQMTVALGCADYLLRRFDLPPAAIGDVSHIRRAAERSAAITQQLLAFSRRQMLRLEAVDLNLVLTDLSTVLQRTLGSDVAIEYRLAPSRCRVMADIGQLQQVLINLALNARDAMPRGGTLRLETSHAVLPEAATGMGTLPALGPGAYCLLTVGDTGCGMDEETLGHIFEPFFTTKPFGEGSGLGLSSVYGIVKQSGGDILVESEPGSGATFRLYFPQAAAVLAEVEPIPAGSSPGHSATVLVAEDDDAVREMICRTLRDEGHQVLEARDGQEALDLLAAAKFSLDLLVADVAMPRLGGLQLSERLDRLAPGLRTLFISGWPGSETMARGLLREDLPLLSKPFSPDGLARQVRQLLQASAPQAL